jgi:hypothetical protein
MASNGINGITYKGDTVIHFNFWDSYPNELGQLMSWYVQKQMDMSLRKKLKHVEKVECPHEFNNLQSIYGLRYASDRILRANPETDPRWRMRGLFEKAEGIAWLMEVEAGRLKHVFHEPDFIHSHSCQFGYILNFNHNTLDYYAGRFNQPCQHAAYSQFRVEASPVTDVYPLQLVQKFPFSMIREARDTADIVSLMNDYTDLAWSNTKYRLLFTPLFVHA